MDNAPAEKDFYQDQSVRVTQSRFIVGNKTYAMRNISSVSIFTIEKSRFGPIAMIVFGAMLLFGKSIWLLGVVIVGLGVAWLFLLKNDYAVRISTNAGEVNSIQSNDQHYIQKIVDALNEALVHRG